MGEIMPGPDGVADALNEPEWPFHYPPVVAGVVQNHQVRLSIASHDDLNAMAEFIAEYSWRMKHDAGTLEHVRGVTEEQKWTLLVERYTAGLTAIMDCCVAGSMSGVVLKIQHRGKVQGVMALNLVTPALSDSWSQHELEQSWRSQTCWIYPAAYTDILAELVGGAENRGRTVLNVPYLVVPLTHRLQTVALAAFARVLKKTYRRSGHSVVANVQTGTQRPRTAFDPYLTRHLGLARRGALEDDVQPPPSRARPTPHGSRSGSGSESSGARGQTRRAYCIYGLFVPGRTPDRYLDDAVRLALELY